MHRPTVRATRAWSGCLIIATIGFAACIRSQDEMIALSDQIEREADSLRWSQAPEGTVVRPVTAETAWALILVPRGGFDEDGAAKAGIRERLRHEVADRSRLWSGAALIVYATPRETSITKLADGIDVRGQTVLHGEPGRSELTIRLSRTGEVVAIASIVARHL